MRDRDLPWTGLFAASVVALTASTGLGQTKPTERFVGVVLKVDPPKEPGMAPTRFTINTASVWADWVRDQASIDGKSPKGAGDQSRASASVAAAGDPEPAAAVATVVLTPDSKLETRFRSSTDEVSEGATTAEGAAKAEASTDPANTPASSGKSQAAAKFKPSDLKPGLWVEVELVKGDREKASRVWVIRAVGGVNIPAAAEAPK